jgi:hypothetical protein
MRPGPTGKAYAPPGGPVRSISCDSQPTGQAALTAFSRAPLFWSRRRSNGIGAGGYAGAKLMAKLVVTPAGIKMIGLPPPAFLDRAQGRRSRH